MDFLSATDENQSRGAFLILRCDASTTGAFFTCFYLGIVYSGCSVAALFFYSSFWLDVCRGRAFVH